MEVVANDKATIDPDGGLIIRVRDSFGPDAGRPLEVHADGKPTEVTRVFIAFDLTVLRPKVRATQLEVLRAGKVINKLPVASAPPLAAPALVRAKSNAPRPTPNRPPPAQMYPPTAQSSVELGKPAPPDVYTLVIYKVEGAAVRSVAYGAPDAKHVFTFTTGGKQ